MTVKTRIQHFPIWENQALASKWFKPEGNLTFHSHFIAPKHVIWPCLISRRAESVPGGREEHNTVMTTCHVTTFANCLTSFSHL